jgi:hypothetical protein
MSTTFKATSVLNGLKDFQARTVEYVFQRMFLDESPARRFLVADEVGLGKTLVARGLIAKTIEHLQQQNDKRIDIVYVCSNLEIAGQNISRLNVTGKKGFALASRLTLLPLEAKNLKGNPINFISFTPGTTFDMSGRRDGRKDERRLIYQMLRDDPAVPRTGLRNMLKVAAGDGWADYAEQKLDYDQDVAKKFRIEVLGNAAPSRERRERLFELSALFHDRRRAISTETVQASLALIGDLRKTLAKVCLDVLMPDLVILDEFQRFRDLLDNPEKNPTAELAHAFFNYSNDLRVLLLSATPYKMYARDVEDEDHYRDFLGTLGFLMFNNQDQIAMVIEHLNAFRDGLFTARSEHELQSLDCTKTAVETILRSVMCRTERVGNTASLDAMIRERLQEPPFIPEDLEDLALASAVAKALNSHDPVEYWKSSPYLLNFMKEYELKRRFESHAGTLPALIQAVDTYKRRLLSRRNIRRFKEVAPANPRLRLMVEEMRRRGLWKMLWMPPSLPYWRPEGCYDNGQDVSKTLLFSAWNVAPDAIASLLSYEVERLMTRNVTPSVTYDHIHPPKSLKKKRFPQRLRFAERADGQVTGLTALALMHPSPSLAELVDPLALALEIGLGETPTLSEVLELAQRILEGALRPLLPDRPVTKKGDVRWYLVAPALLDSSRYPDIQEWYSTKWGVTSLNDPDESQSGLRSVILHFVEALTERLDKLGPFPADLMQVIAELAVGGHAVCALRALRRASPDILWDNTNLLADAAMVAEGFRGQFNAPEVIAFLEGDEGEDESYWRRVLRYGLEGNIQSLLDEQVHVLADTPGLADACPVNRVDSIAAELHRAMSIRAVPLRPDVIRVNTGSGCIEMEPFPISCRYALRFGENKDEDQALARKGVVRVAFNSPFRPFVLASTSVGQEGLDFHVWCHSIVHWNLPSNPVDLEQREGRVHRYKGYAVRKNIARKYGLAALATSRFQIDDPWDFLFSHASAHRENGESDLVPYWIFETEGGAAIERRLFLLPMSRDAALYRRLQKSLALYRMVFAQPRQEDLLTHLESIFDDPGEAARIAERWRICLEPPQS